VNIYSSLNRPLTYSALNGPKDTALVGCVMSEAVFVFRTGFVLRLALAGAAAGFLAGCSNSERFSDPFSNPFQTSAALETQAPAGGVAASAPVSPVQSRPLSAPVASASPSSQQSSRVSALVPPPDLGSAAGWSAQGGSPIVVAQGEDAQILSRRYGVPVDALVRTNGFSAPSQIQPGTRLIIPVYNAALAASTGAHAPPKSSSSKAAAQGKTLGAPPTTLAAQAKALKTASAQASTSKNGTRLADARASKNPKSAKAQKPASNASEQNASSTQVKPGSVQTAKTELSRDGRGPGSNQAATGSSSPSTTASEAANPEFRWPARGRIIQAFKPGGNDGINIALPEGTSIKAVENGVVAYAGNELKGYGNLILIRHPNGFVSAYANASEIDVKRGDTVKRGQTIAKSGQSGNVSTPQLHFELRKGTTPVDPTQYLAGA
jgi:murein DD-endopeptidase MepM/ murein hydrolase activator NlpD